MSNPRPESRIKSLESRATDIEASIEELASDNAESLRAIRQDINALSDKVDQGFMQAHTYIDDHMADLKATMATKDDISRLRDEMTAMEGRLLDAIKQLWQQRPLSSNDQEQQS